MVINGVQGSGKTMAGILTAARLLAYGVNVTVLDRCGHWELLTKLVPGAAHLSIGAGSSHATINPWDVTDLQRVRPEKIAFLRDLHELLVGEHHAGSDRYEISERERSLLSEAIRGVYTRALARASSACRWSATCSPSCSASTSTNATAPAAARPTARPRSPASPTASAATSATARTPTSPTGPPPSPTTRRWSSTTAAPARNQLVPAMFIALERTVANVDARRAQRLSHSGPPLLFPGDALISDETWKLMERRATGEYFTDLARRSRHLGLFMLAITQHLADLDNEYGRPLLRSANDEAVLSAVDRRAALPPGRARPVGQRGAADQPPEDVQGLATAARTGSTGRAAGERCAARRRPGVLDGDERARPRRPAARRPRSRATPATPWAALHELADTEGIR